ncbi:MAG TPA: hypothetical protein VHB01_06860 [Nitrosospira sp.]|nr:hypothetical protein [Nitrosospira sp.]
MSGHWQQLFNYVAGPMHPVSMNARWRTSVPLIPQDIVRQIGDRAAAEAQRAAQGSARNAGLEFVKAIEAQRAAAIAERKRSGRAPVPLATRPKAPADGDDFDPKIEEKVRARAKSGDRKMADLVSVLDAARKGNRDAQEGLGWLLWRGSGGIPIDRGRALVWLNKSAFNKAVPPPLRGHRQADTASESAAPDPRPSPREAPPPPAPAPTLKPPIIRLGRYAMSISKTAIVQPGLASFDLYVQLASDGSLSGKGVIAGSILGVLGGMGTGAPWLENVLSRLLKQDGHPVHGNWIFNPRSNQLSLFISGSIMGHPFNEQYNFTFEEIMPDGVLIGYDQTMTEIRAQRLGD